MVRNVCALCILKSVGDLCLRFVEFKISQWSTRRADLLTQHQVDFPGPGGRTPEGRVTLRGPTERAIERRRETTK